MKGFRWLITWDCHGGGGKPQTSVSKNVPFLKNYENSNVDVGVCASESLQGC